MSSIPTVINPDTTTPLGRAATPGDSLPSALAEVLAPLGGAARESSSLVPSHYSIDVAGSAVEIPKYLLLGQRGGGRPIRLGLFAGFEAGNLETVRVLSSLLVQLKASPALSRDFALIAYPVVNVRGFTAESAPLAEFEARFARDSASPDVQFFKSELNKWRFDGLLSFRTDPAARGFYAAVRSGIIAAEVVEPALAAAAVSLPLATQAVKVRPGDRYARTADYAHGRLSPPADVRPYPFEIELFAPRGPITEKQADGVFVAVTEILRLYRAFIAHGQDL